MIERSLYLVIRPQLTNPLVSHLKEILHCNELTTGIIHDFRFAIVPLAISIGVMVPEIMGVDKDIDTRISNWLYQSICNAMYSLTRAERNASEWIQVIRGASVECSDKDACIRFSPSDLFRQILATCVANMLDESALWPERHGYRIRIDIHPVELGYVCQAARFHSPDYRYKYQQRWADFPEPEVSASRWVLLCKGSLNNIFWEHPWEHFVGRLFKYPTLSEEENPQARAQCTVLPPRALQ
jgi:hypothetical protein